MSEVTTDQLMEKLLSMSVSDLLLAKFRGLARAKREGVKDLRQLRKVFDLAIKAKLECEVRFCDNE